MIIHLNEIPEEGKSFILSNKTGELNKILKDILGTEEYHVEFTIRPIGQGFELKGKGTSKVPNQCSRCGLDIQLNLKAQFNELLMPKLDLDRTAKYAKSNHLSDNDHLNESELSVTDYVGNSFDVGAFVHEAFGLLIPTCPVAETDEKDNCKVCGVNVVTTKFGYDEALPDENQKNPFAVLKGLKLN